LNDVHSAASHGFAKGAETYQRGRPDYPPELLAWLGDALRLGSGRTVVELGAGTGKFTRLLARSGVDILAVEPVDAMRAELAAALPGIVSIAGTAQAIPVADERADAVLCAQSFHWFASTAALEEIHRVLRPRGKLGLVWNVRDDSVDWVAAITRLIAPYEGDAPRFGTGAWRQPFDGPLFTDLIETRMNHRHVGPPREVVLDRFMSVSFIAALADREQAKVRREIETLLSTHPALKGRQSVEMPYITRAYHCTRN
jgi:SAM-dependent methyltransferase